MMSTALIWSSLILIYFTYSNSSKLPIIRKVVASFGMATALVHAHPVLGKETSLPIDTVVKTAKENKGTTTTKTNSWDIYGRMESVEVGVRNLEFSVRELNEKFNTVSIIFGFLFIILFIEMKDNMKEMKNVRTEDISRMEQTRKEDLATRKEDLERMEQTRKEDLKRMEQTRNEDLERMNVMFFVTSLISFSAVLISLIRK